VSEPLAPAFPVAAALAEIERQLEQAGIEEPRREARLLLAAATGWSLATLMAHPDRLLGGQSPKVSTFLAERLARKPISRILGEREFYGLPFRLGPATLDPRPDTEVLVDGVLARLGAEGRVGAPLRLIDLGTGTGAILLALLHHLPAATGLGIDLAPGAVAMAEDNAMRLRLAGRAAFRTGDVLAGVTGRFDVILSNPPYIPTGMLATLAPEVVQHDPVLALDGGADGLLFYRRIADAAPAFLAPGGWLALEVGAGQAGEVSALLAGNGLGRIETAFDLGGIERVVFGHMVIDENRSVEPA
jgi:release factor glutamine methyltransferase